MRAFLLKVKHFFKRNIYPITVSLCTVLILGVVSVSVYNSVKKTDDLPVNNIETSKPAGDDIVDTGNDESSKVENKEPVKPTVSAEPIIFDLPFVGAVVSKQYTDSSLLYDNTTKLWCTHQGLDFSCEEGQKVVAVYAGKIEKIDQNIKPLANVQIQGDIINREGNVTINKKFPFHSWFVVRYTKLTFPLPLQAANMVGERMKPEMTEFLQNKQNSKQVWEGCEGHLCMTRSSG